MRCWSLTHSRLLAVALVLVGIVTAAAANSAADKRPPRGKDRSVQVSAAPVAPVIDGKLDDAAWADAVPASDFWISSQERWPTEQTEVLVSADENAIYFAFRVFDEKPEHIEALQIRPDRGLGRDDAVTVELDPFLNYQQISSFSVSASGVQSSSIGGGRVNQQAWKGSWQSAVVRTTFGWVAEMAIPYAMFNFKPGTERMGVNFSRYQRRTDERSFWADVTPRFLPEERGSLQGLPAMQRGESMKTWSMLPFVVAGKNIPDRRGKLNSTTLDGGMDIRLRPDSDLTALVSLRPDFSLIQASVTNIAFTYNTRIIAESRPFFIEGASYFGSGLLSSRIPDFDWGAKVYGNRDGHSFGGLVTQATAQNPRADVALTDRYRIDPTHSIGASFNGVKLQGEDCHALSIDFAGRRESGLVYGLSGTSATTRGGQSHAGSYTANLGYEGKHWLISLEVDHTSREFYLLNGYVPEDTLGTTGSAVSVDYFRDIAQGRWRALSAGVAFDYRRTGDGQMQSRGLSLSGSAELREAQLSFSMGANVGDYRPCLPGQSIDLLCERGKFEDFLYRDHTLSTSMNGGTRSSRLSWGLTYVTGKLGGADYQYTRLQIDSKPGRTSSLSLASEWRADTSQQQSVVTANWNMNANHTVGIRLIVRESALGWRAAYDWHVYRNLDVYVLWSRQMQGTAFNLLQQAPVNQLAIKMIFAF